MLRLASSVNSQQGAFPEARAAGVLRSLLRFLAYAHEEAGGGELVDPVAWGAAAGGAAGVAWGAGGAAGAAAGGTVGAGGGGGGKPGAAARLVWTGGCGGGQERAAAATAVAAAGRQSGGGGGGGSAAGPATRYGPVAAGLAAVTHGAGQVSDSSGVGSSNSDSIRAASVPAPGLSPQSPPAPPPPAQPPAQLPLPPPLPSPPLLLPLGVVHRDLKLENLLLSAEREEMAMIKVGGDRTCVFVCACAGVRVGAVRALIKVVSREAWGGARSQRRWGRGRGRKGGGGGVMVGPGRGLGGSGVGGLAGNRGIAGNGWHNSET